MNHRNPIHTARRKARHEERERLGLAVPPCILCIQLHHTAGRNHDLKLKAPLCEKHHREMHEQMLRAGISLQHERNVNTRAAMAFRAMAVYGRAQADAMDRWADLLEEYGAKSNER
jgi:hypothetical protein